MDKTAASREKRGNNLATRYTPATTMVAAWIKADTGVGPSIASGSQTCRGNMADFPAPPINTSTNAQVSREIPQNEEAVIPRNCGEPGLESLSSSNLKSSVPA